MNIERIEAMTPEYPGPARVGMCPVCGRGDDNDADPDPNGDGIGWSCLSCDPDKYDPRTDEYGWEKYPSCDMTTREG